MGGHANGAGGAIHHLDLRKTRGPEFGAERRRILFFSERQDLRLPTQRLLVSEFGVVAGCERCNLKTVRIALNDTQSATADRTG
jgi:hypothetical protein